MARDSFKVQNAIKIDGVTITLSEATTGQSLWRNGTSISPRTETPVGTVIMYTGSIGASPGYSGLPNGWLLCDGSTFSSSTYPELASVVGNMYGASAGSTYYLPNFVSKTAVAHTQSSGDTSSGWDGTISSSSGGSTSHSHSTGHNSSEVSLTHSHNSNADQSHGHTVAVSKGEHSHGTTDFNVGSHTHSIQVGATNSNAQTGLSSDGHTHTSANANANHAHNSSNNNSSSHNHNSSSANITDHTHGINVTAFSANQSSNTHSHTTGIPAVGIYFIIKAQ